MMLCGDCSKVEGVVAVGPLRVCAACAEARIRTLEAVAVERTQDWQRERIRAERLRQVAQDGRRIWRALMGQGEHVPASLYIATIDMTTDLQKLQPGDLPEDEDKAEEQCCPDCGQIDVKCLCWVKGPYYAFVLGGGDLDASEAEDDTADEGTG